MTISDLCRGDRRTRGSQLCRTLQARSNDALHSRRRRPDEGALLIEVLVGMFILVLVFTATSITLSAMADTRVKIEQRDRALKLAANYEELSRTYRCGFVVDRVADNLAISSTGLTEFTNNVSNCDFRAKSIGPSEPRVNAGDQQFTVVEQINETGIEQEFTVKIRYWWERAGTTDQTKECTQLDNIEDLPVVLTRAVLVSWQEKGIWRNVSIIKRDPVPSDNVVFASGSRVSLLVQNPSGATVDTNAWEARLYPYGTSTNLYISRIIDVKTTVDPFDPNRRFEGQPARCTWFAYITADDTTTTSPTTRNVRTIVGVAQTDYPKAIMVSGASAPPAQGYVAVP